MAVEPGQYILWEGKLAQIIGTTDQPTAIIRLVREEDRPRCACGAVVESDIHMVIGCRIWQENVRPVATLAAPDAEATP